MSTPIEEGSLSRAVSEVDLNTALRTLKDGGNAVRKTSKIGKPKTDATTKYSLEEIISLRTGGEKNPIDHSEFEYISKPNLHGVVTPPYLTYPRVPPPTPATPETASRTASAELAIVKEDAVEDGEVAKKKKKKSSGKNKKPAPTGFEEFYADPPITPEEYDEETWLYGEAYPFEERIQTCIQRYRARRKLDEVRSNILTKYLMLGGVESSTKAFNGGLDKQTIDNSTAAEITAFQATDYVRNSGAMTSINSKFYDGSKNWVVDFEAVAKGFFSYRLLNMFLIHDQKTLQTYAAVIRNFLNYVLLHAVCPEYTKDVMAAKKTCDMAEKELWAIKMLQGKLPGEFNVAASTIHEGRWKPNDIEATAEWDTENGFEDIVGISRGLTLIDAERIFKTCICLASVDDRLFEEVSKPGVRIVKSENKSYEVVAIERAGTDVVSQYDAVKDAHGEAGTIKPLGVIKFKPWKGARVDEEEYTDAERAKIARGEGGVESFWLEDEILELCFIGLKMEVVVHELNFGWKFFDSVTGLYCSFYTYLHNEKMTHWKEPWPSARPPPTEEDPDVEERAIAAEAFESM